MKLLQKLTKGVNKMLNNEMLVILGGLLVVYLLYQYNNSRGAVGGGNAVPVQKVETSKPAPAAEPAQVGPPAVSNGPSENTPQDLLPNDSNSEWSEFAPNGQGELMGSGSLLHPQISQRPFNSVQGANALRGDPQIAIGEMPSIAAPSNPVQGNSRGLN